MLAESRQIQFLISSPDKLEYSMNYIIRTEDMNSPGLTNKRQQALKLLSFVATDRPLLLNLDPSYRKIEVLLDLFEGL